MLSRVGATPSRLSRFGAQTVIGPRPATAVEFESLGPEPSEALVWGSKVRSALAGLATLYPQPLAPGLEPEVLAGPPDHRALAEPAGASVQQPACSSQRVAASVQQEREALQAWQA